MGDDIKPPDDPGVVGNAPAPPFGGITLIAPAPFRGPERRIHRKEAIRHRRHRIGPRLCDELRHDAPVAFRRPGVAEFPERLPVGISDRQDALFQPDIGLHEYLAERAGDAERIARL